MIGSRLGPYVIRAELGRGGMATVYRAYHPAVDRDVAIKVLNAENRDPAFLKRFHREAQFIARLEHPHILPIYDFVVDHEPPFIVMRYADGGTLKEVMGRQALTFDQIVMVVRQIASALAYAHGLGIIHRDIKPSNILFDQHGNALLADFGIARTINHPEHTTELTQAGAVIGTPGYMAPEQSLGATMLTVQTDIYAFGVMFFEMVTGQVPYKADSSIALIMKHVQDPIPAITALRPDLSPAADLLIARAMAKDATERFESVTAFAHAAVSALERSQSVGDRGDAGSLLAIAPSGGLVVERQRGEARTDVDHQPGLRLSLSLLGSVQITLNEQPIAGFDYDKVRALLLFLVMDADQPHRRETVAELLWPDQPDQIGRDNLRQALATLRRHIRDHEAKPPFLLITRETLQFNRDSAYRLDAETFVMLLKANAAHQHAHADTCAECIQRLEEAAELYRGAFAQDLALPNNDEFTDWLTAQRETFQERALNALHKVAAYHESRAAYDLAQRCAWRQIELEPWREEAYQQLMRLLARAGQRTAALSQYERCCRILEEQLGVEPSAETKALYEQIRDGEVKVATQYAIVAASGRRSNVPTPPTSFVGRQKELKQVLEYLAYPASRLVSIVGLGGIGKTRLAIEAARQAESMFEHVCYVSLASLENPALIASEIASALQFATTNHDDFTAQLVNYLRDKKLLLVIDNLEQFTGKVEVLSKIVATAPSVKLLLTSRERLNLSGEWVLPLKGLPTTADASDQGVIDSAVDLFIQRAQMVLPDFFVASQQVLPDILRICQLVDGMPLGIELAATWMQMLTCREIADSIESNLGFLTATTTDTPQRHQSLRVVFDYSWQLLSSEQQRVLRTLAVFRGGFQADAALEVSGATLPTLLALVSKSMLTRDSAGRYQIHELLRQYALEKLRDSGETDQTLARHLQFFVNLAEGADAQIRGGQQIPLLERLEAENDNLRTALDFSLNSQATEGGLRLAASLWFFWHERNYFREGLQWLQVLIAAVPDATPVVRAKALFAAGWLAQSNRDLPQAALYSRESYEVAEQVGDSLSIAYPLSTLAWLTYFVGDYQQATSLGEKSLALFREVNESWGIVHTLNILGYIAESQADYARAEQLQREGINVARAAGDVDSLGWSTYLLARVLAERAQYQEAILLCHQCVEIYRELGNRWGRGAVLYTLGEATMELNDLTPAAAYLEESIALGREAADFWFISGPLGCLGLLSYRRGDLERAEALCRESLAYFQQFKDKRGMAYVSNTLGGICFQRAQYEEATRHYKEGLSLRREASIRRGAEVAFDGLAALAVVSGDSERAAALIGAAEAVREALNVIMPGAEVAQYALRVESLRHQLTETVFRDAVSWGQSLSFDEAISYAIGARGNTPGES